MPYLQVVRQMLVQAMELSVQMVRFLRLARWFVGLFLRDSWHC